MIHFLSNHKHKLQRAAEHICYDFFLHDYYLLLKTNIMLQSCILFYLVVFISVALICFVFPFGCILLCCILLLYTHKWPQIKDKMRLLPLPKVNVGTLLSLRLDIWWEINFRMVLVKIALRYISFIQELRKYCQSREDVN